MGQKVNPIALRLGYIRGWESNWYSEKDYAVKLLEDNRIRNYIFARLSKGGIARIVIERTLKRITVTIHTSRPGLVIGKGGNEVDKLKEELKKITGKDVQINIYEIRRPELEAVLVADNIASQLKARMSYRRAMKMAISSAIRMGAQGIKIKCSGRLGGAEMARTEEYKEGRIPLHTFRSDIDYAYSASQTIYGTIGIKVWICKGEVLGKRDLSLNFGASEENSKKMPRRGGGPQRKKKGSRY
jgi:small subunit ribosomal protein S3